MAPGRLPHIAVRPNRDITVAGRTSRCSDYEVAVSSLWASATTAAAASALSAWRAIF